MATTNGNGHGSSNGNGKGVGWFFNAPKQTRPAGAQVVNFPKPGQGVRAPIWGGSVARRAGFGTVDPTNPPSLNVGSSGQDVIELQGRLTAAGFPPDGGIDGQYGSGTANAVQAFQSANGFDEDGAGSQTWQALISTTPNYVGPAAQAPMPPKGSTISSTSIEMPPVTIIGRAPKQAANFFDSLQGWQKALVVGGLGVAGAFAFYLLFSHKAKRLAGLADAVAGDGKCGKFPSLDKLAKMGRPL